MSLFSSTEYTMEPICYWKIRVSWAFFFNEFQVHTSSFPLPSITVKGMDQMCFVKILVSRDSFFRRILTAELVFVVPLDHIARIWTKLIRNFFTLVSEDDFVFRIRGIPSTPTKTRNEVSSLVLERLVPKTIKCGLYVRTNVSIQLSIYSKGDLIQRPQWKIKSTLTWTYLLRHFSTCIRNCIWDLHNDLAKNYIEKHLRLKSPKFPRHRTLSIWTWLLSYISELNTCLEPQHT